MFLGILEQRWDGPNNDYLKKYWIPLWSCWRPSSCHNFFDANWGRILTFGRLIGQLAKNHPESAVWRTTKCEFNHDIARTIWSPTVEKKEEYGSKASEAYIYALILLREEGLPCVFLWRLLLMDFGSGNLRELPRRVGQAVFDAQPRLRWAELTTLTIPAHVSGGLTKAGTMVSQSLLLSSQWPS